MRAIDLRIGNFIKFSHLQGNVIQIRHDSCEINTKKIVIRASYEDLEPIPLTEEILLKCGFVQYMSPSDLRISICSGVLLQFHFGVNQLECWIGDEINRIDVIYLHQLQNLYWCLCGEELTVNL